MSLANSSAVQRLRHFGPPELASLIVSLLGLALRVEHALTFNGPLRGSDYGVFIQGLRWMLLNRRPFDFAPDVSTQIGYQPPLFFAIGAAIMSFTGEERPVAWLAVIGWVVRQLILARILKEIIPHHRWASFCALAVSAILPLSVLTDGKVNPEGLHTALFTVAIYALWRMEREARSLHGARYETALVFGVYSGLAVLTKATAGVLPLIAAIEIAWLMWTLRSDPLRGTKALQLLRVAGVAALAWCAVAGWWCGPNLIKYHHPFPHVWNLTKHPADPLLYRRPLGWILPFEWSRYMTFPVIYTPSEPRPNFWSTVIVGSWTDIYNRGFCRLAGGPYTNRVFGANWGPRYGPEWWMSLRCIDLFVKLAWVGVVLAFEAIVAVGWVLLQQLRTAGRRGSFVLPLTIGLVGFFVMLFALTYPYDNQVVLNPRYLLPAVTPMCACFGIALAQMPFGPTRRGVVYLITFLALGLAGGLLLYERFGS